MDKKESIISNYSISYPNTFKLGHFQQGMPNPAYSLLLFIEMIKMPSFSKEASNKIVAPILF